MFTYFRELDITAAVKELRNLQSTLEAVYISAGVFSFQSIDNFTIDEFERTFTINTRAPFLLVSALIDRIRADDTDVIFINSVALIPI